MRTATRWRHRQPWTVPRPLSINRLEELSVTVTLGGADVEAW
jgi:hypothetical protein